MADYQIIKDLDTFKDFAVINESDLAAELGFPRSTLHSWRTGKSFPSASSLEKVYSYMYRKNYRLNMLQEQLYLDSRTLETVFLFHGAKSGLKGEISLNCSGASNDFGKGFYLGENLAQAASFVCNYPEASVYVAKLTLKNSLRVIEYNVDTAWMLTIAWFRGKLNEFEHSAYLQNVLSEIDGADIIRAPIADNRMFQILDEFINGNITDLQCKSALSATDLGKQYVILTEKGLKNLEIVHRCYLCREEKEDYLAGKNRFDLVSSQKVKFVKREFAGKGKYIDEILV